MRKFALLVGAVAALVSACVVIWIATKTEDFDEPGGGWDNFCYPRVP